MSRGAGRRLSGGFWRRLVVGVLDVVLVLLLLDAVGIVAYGPSAGLIRISAPIISQQACSLAYRNPEMADQVLPTPPRVRLPEGFRADMVDICTKSVFGREFDRTVRVIMSEPVGMLGGLKVSNDKHIDFALDQSGRAMDAIYLDPFLGPLVLVWLTLWEWLFGITPFKAMFGLKVTQGRGERPGLVRSLWRNTLLWGWAAGFGVVSLFLGDVMAASDWAIWVGFGLWMLIIAFGLAFLRPNPLHDRLSGIRVTSRSDRRNWAGRLW